MIPALPLSMHTYDEQCVWGEYVRGASAGYDILCYGDVSLASNLGLGVGKRGWGKKAQEDKKGKGVRGHKPTIISPAPPHSIGLFRRFFYRDQERHVRSSPHLPLVP